MTREKDRKLDIRQRVHDLQHSTLHGPVPLKTTMQLVEDLALLLDERDEIYACDKCDLCEDHHG